ncbi:MAG: hypothetical protein COA88_15710 [Kordia sp.]|nr:MAG: hypothetical protein COA88_15710 [Kordia sp.]
MLDKSLILKSLKKELGFKYDSDFAKYLDILPQTLASWHKRNTYDVDLLYTKCKGIDANYLLTGKGEILLTNNNQQQPTVAPTGDLEKDLVAKFSNVRKEDIAIYVAIKEKEFMNIKIFSNIIDKRVTEKILDIVKSGGLKEFLN